MNVHLLNIFFKMTDKKSYQLKTNLIEKYIVDEYRMIKGEIDYIFNTFVLYQVDDYNLYYIIMQMYPLPTGYRIVNSFPEVGHSRGV